MITLKTFSLLNRYQFDRELSSNLGWAHLDTDQDAPYFGQWANPFSLEYASYCEGDVTRQVAESDAEFIAAINETAAWYSRMGYTLRIDPGFLSKPEVQKAVERWKALGLGDLLH